MCMYETEVQPRVGSFLPEHVPIKRRPWKRNKEVIINRVIAIPHKKDTEAVRRQTKAGAQRGMLELIIWRFERLYKRLPHVVLGAKNMAYIANSKKLSKRMELFVTYLLHMLQVRGDVVHYGWYRMYKEGNEIDRLGVDQWCLLAPKHGGLFCVIDTKSSPAGVAGQRQKHRDIIYAFYPGMNPKDKLTKGEVENITDRLLSELKQFFCKRSACVL